MGVRVCYLRGVFVFVWMEWFNIMVIVRIEIMDRCGYVYWLKICVELLGVWIYWELI